MLNQGKKARIGTGCKVLTIALIFMFAVFATAMPIVAAAAESDIETM